MTARDEADTDRPALRADAERNRQRILSAASEVFAERGLDVSLDDIAEAAGVGIGTVYRRFGDKDALIDALLENRVGEVVELARRCLEEPDAWTAFSRFVYGVCGLNAQDRGLKEALLSDDRGGDRIRRGRDQIAPLAFELLRRAQAAGVVRADLAGTDVPLLHFGVGYVAERTRDVAPEYWQRAATILLDGLVVRRDGPSPLPADALTPDQLPQALGRRR
ncbi:MAG TPA: helix-turn-helix domain-containing protein [Capillimicrobium sp.]|jgi:AcrR family transcriptional regulator